MTPLFVRTHRNPREKHDFSPAPAPRVMLSAQKQVLDCVKCFYTNADSLLNKINELKARIADNESDIITISESLTKHASVPVQKFELELPGYQLHWNGDRSNKHRGICVYTKEGIPVRQIDEPLADYNESVWISVGLGSRDEHLVLGTIYRSPSSVTEENQKLYHLIDAACKKYKGHLILCGDFNIPELKWMDGKGSVGREATSTVADAFLKCIDDNYLHQHTSFPTRIRENQRPSCLDLVLSTEPAIISSMERQDPLGRSDHVCILWKLEVQSEKAVFTRSSYNFNKGDYEKYRRILGEANWSTGSDESTEGLWKELKENVLNAAERSIPKRRVGTLKKPKWLDRPTILLLKQRNKAWKKYLHTRNPAHLEVYKRLRNQATWRSRQSRRRFEKEIASKATTDSKAFWSFVRAKTSSRSNIGDLIGKDGSVAREPTDKAEVLNTQYQMVFTSEDTQPT